MNILYNADKADSAKVLSMVYFHSRHGSMEIVQKWCSHSNSRMKSPDFTVTVVKYSVTISNTGIGIGIVEFNVPLDTS